VKINLNISFVMLIMCSIQRLEYKSRLSKKVSIQSSRKTIYHYSSQMRFNY